MVFDKTHSGTLTTPKVISGALRLQSDVDYIEPTKEVRDGYLISLNLGIPSQVVQVYMDIGNDLTWTWVPCGNVSFNYPKVPCPNNTCMLNGDHDYDDQLTRITFYFSGNASVVLPKGNSFYDVSPLSNSSIVNCFLYREMDDGEFGPATVFGSFQQQNVEVVYDLERERIEFQQVDCVAFADSLGLH